MKVVVVRLDLDRYDAYTLACLVRDGVITVGDACEAESVKRMSDLNRLLWVRKTKELTATSQKEAA